MNARRLLAAWLLASATATAAPVALEEETHHLQHVHAISVSSDRPYYSPAELTIRAGETVHWSNAQIAETHSVYELGRAAFMGTMVPGASWTQRFDREGVYEYGCRFHPWMRGRITVLPARLRAEAIHLPELASDTTVQLVEAQRQIVAVAVDESGSRLFALDGDARLLMRVEPTRADVPPVATPDGRVWLASRRGLVAVDPARRAVAPLVLPEVDVVALAVDPAGRPWLFDGRARRFGVVERGRARWWSGLAAETRRFVVDGRERVVLADGSGRLMAWSARERLTLLDGAAQSLASDGEELVTVSEREHAIIVTHGEAGKRTLHRQNVAAGSTVSGSRRRGWWFVPAEPRRLARLFDGGISRLELNAELRPATLLADGEGRLWAVALDGTIERLQPPPEAR